MIVRLGTLPEKTSLTEAEEVAKKIFDAATKLDSPHSISVFFFLDTSEFVFSSNGLRPYYTKPG